MCLIQGTAGPAVVEEATSVEGAPLPVDGAGHVGRHDVGVEKRVIRSAGAVVEGGGDHAVGGGAFSFGAGADCLRFDETDGLIDRLGVGSPYGRADVIVTEGPQDADALGWAENEVVTRSSLGLVAGGGEPVDLFLGNRPGLSLRTGQGFDLRADKVSLRERGGVHADGHLGGLPFARLRSHEKELADALLGDPELAGGLQRVERRAFGGLRSGGCLPAGGRPGGGSLGADQVLAGERVLSLQDGAEVALVDPALQAHAGRQGADPTTRGFAVAGVVVIGGGGDLADVVVDCALAEPPYVEHDLTSLSEVEEGDVGRFRRIDAHAGLEMTGQAQAVDEELEVDAAGPGRVASLVGFERGDGLGVDLDPPFEPGDELFGLRDLGVGSSEPDDESAVAVGVRSVVVVDLGEERGQGRVPSDLAFEGGPPGGDLVATHQMSTSTV